MTSAEEFYDLLTNTWDISDTAGEETIRLIKQRDLESRIAGLREALDLAFNKETGVGPRVAQIEQRIAELEKELKP